MSALRLGTPLAAPMNPFDLGDDEALDWFLEQLTVAGMRDVARRFGWRLSGTRRDDIVAQMRAHYADPQSVAQVVDALDESNRRLLALVAWLGPRSIGALVDTVSVLQPHLPDGWLGAPPFEDDDEDDEWLVLAISELSDSGCLMGHGDYGEFLSLPGAFAEALLPLPELAPATLDPDGLHPEPVGDPVRDLCLAWNALREHGPAVVQPDETVVQRGGRWPVASTGRAQGGSPQPIRPAAGSVMPPEAEAAVADALGDGDAARVAFWGVVVAALAGQPPGDDDRAAPDRAALAGQPPGDDDRAAPDRAALAAYLDEGSASFIVRAAEAWVSLPYGLWDELSWLRAARPGVDWTLMRAPGHWGFTPRLFAQDLVVIRLRVLESVRRWSRGHTGTLGQWVDLAAASRFTQAVFPGSILPVDDSKPWYAADTATAEPLVQRDPADWARGSERVLHYLLRGPLRWLGIVETATDARGRLVAARLTPAGQTLIDRQPPPAEAAAPPEWIDEWVVDVVPGAAHGRALAGMYALAEPEGVRDGCLRFRFTDRGLQPAFEAGLSPDEIVAALELRGVSVPEGLGEVIADGWARWGRVRLYDELAVIELADELLAREILATTDLGRRIVYRCSPTAFVVEPEAVADLVAALESGGHTPRVVEADWGR